MVPQMSLTDSSVRQAHLQPTTDRDGYPGDDADDYVDSDSADEPPLHDPNTAQAAREHTAGKPETEAPVNFSRIDVSVPATVLRRAFPDFPGRHTAITCELHAGKALPSSGSPLLQRICCFPNADDLVQGVLSSPVLQQCLQPICRPGGVLSAPCVASVIIVHLWLSETTVWSMPFLQGSGIC